MNRFRNKKKGRDDASIGGRPSMDVEPSGPFRMFGKKKTQDDEPKKEVDITVALPPSDDFRTSLLMTGLSARFSMLREQDDPKSKLGKASDDSVLYPKRQSRLADFGGLGGGLHDIAEIESLKAPPLGRFDSYQSDDAASTTGSIMSRSKPTEGNNLFGGRQKIYKLAAGSRAGMSGRALYDDDVAQSSFQRWRQAERERKSSEEEQRNNAFEAESTLNYNRRRETSSTTSSVPSAPRNSTAATSIASQPSSIKDTQPANHLPGLERSVTRTRRLYEQGLTQDLQDHQSSALSRMDTLSKQRPFGSRTPDPVSAIPSPTASNFGDRVTERRPILSKASAPNLRSFSPSTVGPSQMSPADSTSKFPRQEQKANFGSSPPLSPPISETEEHPGLAIQPGDRGKATAMGVFNRPAMQYDESRYAQRQRQLQQGRDISTSRHTTESTTSSIRDRSRSSSAQRATPDRPGPGPQTPLPEGPVRNEGHGATFFDDSDDGSIDNSSVPSATAPQLTIERPDDQDHPAFRKSAVPTPLSLNFPQETNEQSSPSPGHQPEQPEDSPTLGPNPNAGLSGMVRQHLRNDSTASSVYGPGYHETESSETGTNVKNSPGMKGLSSAEDHQPGHQDEFAQHLADGARRVRERLTTYVESDNDRSAPPTPPQSEQNKEFGASRSGGLGILRSKSSRNSLFEKSEKERGRAKALKSPGYQANPADTSPSPRKVSSSRGGSRGREMAIKTSEPAPAQPEDNIHVGLKAFRQARRELQKMKELEVQQRHTQKSSPSQERLSNSRVTSYESGPPPALFNRMPREDQNYGNRSRAGSRATSERDRSGSETSSGGRAYSRGPRLRNGSATYEEHMGRPGINGATSSDAKHQIMESPSRSPYAATGPSHVGMSPSHSVGAFEPSNRYYAPGMQGLPPQDLQQYGRARNGSLLGAAASTPNLHGSALAPPLPPINPRRKNGYARNGEEGSVGNPPNSPFGMVDGYTGDDEVAGDQFRNRKHVNGQLRHSPPRAIRPPLPHSNMSSASLPGGMI
ncbi:hypothetical protein QQS21_011150 [Conoideocrella luteorostrata]|uniref:Uncharacterized protein n=1 Tax=Conoideocrella luteorostrata TaxID=1105319 RepID=A0AAJ0CI58_9HYPO|nr:hypothetical protein QQS21_011150 [Conoideocrella luteorostrata]